MHAGLRLPAQFQPYSGNSIISDLFTAINYEIAEAIKGKDLYAQYSGWDYLGKVWWDEATEYWCAEIWKNYEYVCSHMTPTLPELRTEIMQTHGER